MKNKPVIVGIGELLWDMLPSGKKAGGAPVNFVYHASLLGAESYAISAIGKDALGDEILQELDKIKLSYFIERVDYPTGTVLVQLKEGIPNYTIIENVAWDYIPATEEVKQLARRTDAICFGTLAQRSAVSRSTIHEILSLVPQSAYRILDINIRQHFYSKQIIEESLRLCNVFKMNDDELELLREMFPLDGCDEDAACRWFLNHFDLKVVILTAGADYSKVITKDDYSCIQTTKVKVVDTVGAGDSFTGAFISSLIEGKSLQESHQFAVDKAAYVCTKAGAWTV
ncbi:carbohydrate kinase [Macellibacteroides fermentans]